MKINNKGYMLVEIILAFSIAMAIMYFVVELTIKVKNKNDDLLVRTLTAADQAIIYNMIMSDLYDNGGTFSCSNVKISGRRITYKGKTNIVNDYIDYLACVGNTIILNAKILGNDYNIVIPS